VISVAIEPKTKADQERWALLWRGWPTRSTFKVRTDDESGRRYQRHGELHLEILVDRMKREHKVEANVGEPKVAFARPSARRRKLKAVHSPDRRLGNYGHCKLRIEPNTPGAAMSSLMPSRAARCQGIHQAIDQGVQGAIELGILAGYPLVDIKVTLFDGSYHEVDSNEMASSLPDRSRSRKRRARLLRCCLSVMAVEVTVPRSNGDHYWRH